MAKQSQNKNGRIPPKINHNSFLSLYHLIHENDTLLTRRYKNCVNLILMYVVK